MRIKRLLILINCLLAGLVVFTGVQVISGRWPQSRDREIQGSKSDRDAGPQVTPPAPRTLEAYRMVIDQDVFNTPKSSGPGSHPQEKIKNTALQVRLKGTILGQDQRSYAVILDGQTGREDLYAQNDFVQGARILEIQKERVILSTGGAREALDMDAGKGAPSREAQSKAGIRASAPPKPGREVQRSVRREPGRPAVKSPSSPKP